MQGEAVSGGWGGSIVSGQAGFGGQEGTEAYFEGHSVLQAKPLISILSSFKSSLPLPSLSKQSRVLSTKAERADLPLTVLSQILLE